MTFGRNPNDRPSPTGLGPAPSALDGPYGQVADGFGGHGPAPDGFGGAPAQLGAAGHQEVQQAAPAAGAPAAAPPAMRLAVPPVIDFGEVVAGENPTASRPIYNVHPTHTADVQIRLTGAPELALLSAPTRLRPSHEGSDAPVVLRYLPTQRADSKATLKIRATWQMGVWPDTEVEIPVVGKAYASGENSHAEEAAAQRAASDRADAAAGAAARDRGLDDAVAKDNEIAAPYPQGGENMLADEYNRAERGLTEVAANQLAGVTAASAEAAAFKRKIPHSDPSLMFTLAMFGLDMATAGIAGAMAKRVSRVLGREHVIPVPPRLEHGRVLPPSADAQPTIFKRSEESIAFVTDALKQGLKDAGKASRKAVVGSGAHEGGGGADAPWIDFFANQAVALNGATKDRGDALGLVLTRLRPLLRSDAAQARAAMAAIADGLEEAAGMARDEQQNESSFAWMRFLSQSSLGALDPGEAAKQGLAPGKDGEPITDTRDLAVAPGQDEAMPRVDGVLDLEFIADLHHPTAPVKVIGAAMTGVTTKMAERLRGQAPAELGVVIRAHGRVRGLANLPIVVIRDEAGNLRFDDDTGSDGVLASWLAKKGGGVHDSPERRRLGAQQLMDEVASLPLAEVKVDNKKKSTKGIDVVTDDQRDHHR